MPPKRKLAPVTSSLDALELARAQIGRLEREESGELITLPQLKIMYKAMILRFYGRFKLAVVCALPKEYAAMMRSATSQEYIFHHIADVQYRILRFPLHGRDDLHEVILVKAPQMGNSSSVIASISVFKDFPSIRDIIMVGIAGGIPNVSEWKMDVRVGDIVVSESFAHYDLTKIEAKKIVVQSEAPKPSQKLAGVAFELESERIFENWRPWEIHVEECSKIEGGERPPKEADKFYGKRRYGDDSDPRRKSSSPVVHYGTIAAANPLVKNEYLRDELQREYGVLAIEKEQSGLSDASWFEGKGYLTTCEVPHKDLLSPSTAGRFRLYLPHISGNHP